MKRKALWKDSIIEVKKTYQRFLSILLIVALGVAFFAGLRACRLDMEITADRYYDDLNLMDLRIISTMGLTNEDVNALHELSMVKDVEVAFTKDVLIDAKDSELVMKTYSLNDTINRFYVISGRTPSSIGECMVDTALLENTGYSIGDEIIIKSGNADDDLSEAFATTRLEIVGSCKDARYLTYSRGSSTIGNGKVNSFLVLPKATYKNQDIYQELAVTIVSAKEQLSYSNEYDDLMKEAMNQIDNIVSSREDARYEEIIQEPKEKLEDGKAELNDAKTELAKKKEEAIQKFADADKQLLEQEELLIQKRKETETLREQLVAAGYEDSMIHQTLYSANIALSEGEEKLAEERMTYESAKASAMSEINSAEQEIMDFEAELKDVEIKILEIQKPIWYVLDRNTIESYVSYGDDAKRMDAIAQVFPAIFFLVAALVCLTTMTRMVDEHRIQIGILKAIGYSKAFIAMKYILYAFVATVIGSILGVLIGQKVFPFVIISSYQIMYVNLPYVIHPYQMNDAWLAGVLAVCCTTFATVAACNQELISSPAVLMRPAAPKAGKRIVLEYIPWLWKHLNFTKKSTLRNLFRYKKRLFMTVIGISGCMALLLVGYGIKDSIGVMADKQYSELWKENAIISLKKDTPLTEQQELIQSLSRNDKIKRVALAYEGSYDVSANEITKNMNLVVLDDSTEYDEFFLFQNRITKERYHLSEEGVIISEKLAKLLKVKVGDKISIALDDFTKRDVQITAITENYIFHRVFMPLSLYQEVWNDSPKYNQAFLINQSTEEAFERELFSELLLENNNILSISSTNTLQKTIDDMLKSLNTIVYVLIICAGLLAFIVLYNLSYINITERKRELASLKVLGFYNREVNAYVMKENIILTIFGIILGIGLGILLHRFVIVTSEIDAMMFGRLIKGSSFIYSSLLTVFFSLIVSFVMYFKIKRIDMIESLKSVE